MTGYYICSDLHQKNRVVLVIFNHISSSDILDKSWQSAVVSHMLDTGEIGSCDNLRDFLLRADDDEGDGNRQAGCCREKPVVEQSLILSSNNILQDLKDMLLKSGCLIPQRSSKVWGVLVANNWPTAHHAGGHNVLAHQCTALFSSEQNKATVNYWLLSL